MNQKTITPLHYLGSLFLTTILVLSILAPLVPQRHRGLEQTTTRSLITYHEQATAAATKCGLEAGLFHAVITTESAWNPIAQSEVGAFGLAQLMPNTAKWLQINYRNPNDNLIGGACYLSSLIAQFGSVSMGLQAYHAGPGNVRRGKIGPKTRAYVRKILTLYDAE